jgi:two-component system, OmpR family, sensor histidine kinase KdpD
MLSVGLLTAVLYLLDVDPHFANVSMLYLLVVTLIALFLGRGPAIWASLLSFLSFDWFFVNPRHTFAVQEPGEWIALCMFLLTANIIGQLTALLKARALEAQQHQKETAVLAESSWAVASHPDCKSALTEVVRQVARVVDLDMAAVLVPDHDSSFLHVVSVHPPEATVSQWQCEQAYASINETGSPRLDSNRVLYLPIKANDVIFGVIVLNFSSGQVLTPQQSQIIESLVSHSAVILQREQLAIKEAQVAALAEADKLKTALLSMVSHDFRSPLTSIKASVSTLLSDGPPLDQETQAALFQGIENEADRLNRIVSNILNLSRLEANAWKLRCEPTAVGELVGMALDSFDNNANKRITVALDPSLPEITCDSTQIVQVLKNLIENALKYSPADSQIEIEIRRLGHEAIMEICDRGRGGLPANPDDVFKPFWRAADLQESSIPGVGIGLAVCRGLVEAHGGSVQAENRKGGGATFRVKLPVVTSSEQSRLEDACSSHR